MSRSVWCGLCLALAAPAVLAQAPPTPGSAAPTVPDAKPASDPLTELLKPTIEVRGRVEADAIFASQSQQSRAAIGDLQNAYGFRRVRLGAQGTLGEAAKWVAEAELAGVNVRLRDTYAGLIAIPGVNELKVGYFREPFSLEGATSSRFITFMERSPLNVLDPTRNWGVAGLWWPDSQRVLFETGLFRDGTATNGQSSGDDANWAVTSRLSGLPVYESEGSHFRLVQIGAAVTFRNPANGMVNFAPGPQSSLLTVEDNPMSPFLPAVAIPANGVQGYNLQFANVVGAFSTQAEWFGTSIQQTNAGVVFVHGFYVDASYFLTGEHRGYDRTRGSFDRVVVRRPLVKSPDCPGGGFGAVELAARFAYFDFNSPNLPLADDGGSPAAVLYQFTVGVNWYLNDFTRLMFNYTAAFPDPVAGPAVSAHVFSTRLAVYW